MSVTRRSFLQAAGAVLLLPRLIVRPQVDTHAILARFCDKPEGYTSRRLDLDSPFVFDRHAYGTDGRALCRIDTTAADTLGDERRIPKLTTEWWND